MEAVANAVVASRHSIIPICFARISYASTKPVCDIHDTDEALMLLKNLTKLHVSTNQSGCNSFHQMVIYKCEILYRFKSDITHGIRFSTYVCLSPPF